jgi:putative transposase
MQVNYAYKFRLKPNKQQKMLLLQHFGCNRFVWNYFLHQRQEYYQKNKEDIEAKRIKGNCSYYNDAKELVKMKKQEEYNWLKEVNSQTLLSTLQHLDTAYKNFFKKQTKFPNYKKKFDNQSFTIPQHIRIENGKIYFPKFSEGIRLKEHRKLEGKICNATISKTSTNQFYVSIIVEKNVEPLKISDKNVGIDVGIKDFCILSNGTRYENIKPLKKQLKKIKYLSRQVSKSKKASKKREARKLKLAILHQRIHNQRLDYLHKITKSITDENQVIVIEDLNVKEMMKNQYLSQSISDVSWHEFKRQLEYKCKWKGRQLVIIDRYFPSSKTCNHCGYINQELTLNVREWECPQCNSKLDRDLNASINILQQGLNIAHGIGVKSKGSCLQ